ncbi:BMP family lipoprotein [Cellulomonas bogoriensis]|uniref:Membrane protein n=1 Tax=Cellulomonas bogoriensis 69B4 = DSM 16987 TaxID=1386082 RepID=A0A0A0BZJ9_9CELL|nr:BMP family ABC transporter substrate-binding protein [Cellulomonas bogoriensis]KGM13351.1 membrane protein [Cellulomonas bogoriensis 69B4 = DSM 16987]
MKIGTRAAVLATATALALAACGTPPPDEPEATATDDARTPEVEQIDYRGCIVSDAGGFDDRSFNQAGYEGLTQARDELGIEISQAESQGENEFVPNIDSMVNQGCDLVITVGYLLADATGGAAEANPETHFAIIDDQSVDADNVKPLVFNTAEAAFLAGYLAAGYSTTGTVATFGGMQIPPVTIFMDGFVDGVAHYNEVKGAEVRVLGWDKDAQTGDFTGDFDDIAAGQNLARAQIDQGADVIMPVAGPVGAGGASAAQQSDGVAFIGVDKDWYETSPEFADVTLTSVLKQMTPAVFDVLSEAVAGNFDNTPYVGTLENDGVGLAPFHDLEGEVSEELAAEVEQLRQDIVAGEIVVESPSTP